MPTRNTLDNCKSNHNTQITQGPKILICLNGCFKKLPLQYFKSRIFRLPRMQWNAVPFFQSVNRFQLIGSYSVLSSHSIYQWKLHYRSAVSCSSQHVTAKQHPVDDAHKVDLRTKLYEHRHTVASADKASMKTYCVHVIIIYRCLPYCPGMFDSSYFLLNTYKTLNYSNLTYFATSKSPEHLFYMELNLLRQYELKLHSNY